MAILAQVIHPGTQVGVSLEGVIREFHISNFHSRLELSR
jgi:hypothetical protein